ncbi:MAG: hypothetical protein OXE85_13625 [Roseovarius sp.]|nr:hypothetical protein [Roseovarius sp.]
MSESADAFQIQHESGSGGRGDKMQVDNDVASLQDSAFCEIVDNVASNPASASAQILNDQFRKDGVGLMSSLYRALSSAREREPERELIERWSSALEISALLWDRGHKEAAVRMLQVAETTLCPPKIYERRISNSICYGQDYILFKMAREKFLTGEDESAMESIGKMSEFQRSDQLRKFEKLRGKRRSTRRLAFLSAAVSGFFFAAAIAHGLIGFRETIRNPHEISWPYFHDIN